MSTSIKFFFTSAVLSSLFFIQTASAAVTVTPLGAGNKNWSGITSTKNGDIYATINNDIYKQTGGTGAFVAISAGARGWYGITSTPNGDIYVTTFSGDIYKQTGGTGTFVPLNAGNKAWDGIISSPNGDIYAIVSNGDIYKQTGGMGTFVPLNAGNKYWAGITSTPNGDIYASVNGGDIYKQTGGTGTFVPLNAGNRSWYGITSTLSGDIYGTVYGDAPDIYKQTGGTGTFVPLNAGNKYWVDITSTPNGNLYAVVYGGDIYKITDISGAPTTQSLTITKPGTGTGSVTSSPAGIDCGATCAGNFTTGAAVTLTATPATGSTFAGWTGACTNTTGVCTVAMSAAKSVTATFTSTGSTGSWTYPTDCPSVCGTAQSTQTAVCTGGTCTGSATTRICNATAACPASDITAPVITILGSNPVTSTVGVAYVDAGATALDVVDGAKNVTVSSNVVVSTIGAYRVVYTARDVAGNEASSTRIVNVIAAASAPLPEGCTATTLFSPLTGQKCVVTTLPEGCTSTVGYSPLTGIKCDTGEPIDTPDPIEEPIPNSSSCVFITSPLLKFGTQDSQVDGEVSDLQTFLKTYSNSSTGMPYLTGNTSGSFGPNTRAAVKVFQGDPILDIQESSIDSTIITSAADRHNLARSKFRLSRSGNVGLYTRAKIAYVSCLDGGTVTPPTEVTPRITSLSPASGPVGTNVTISATGLAERNEIYLDRILIETKLSNNPNLGAITFTVPDSFPQNCSSSGACTNSISLVNPGTHSISVKTQIGMSNSMTFTVSGGMVVDTPTASFTINGVQNATLTVGQSHQKAWTSTGGTSWNTTYRFSQDPANTTPCAQKDASGNWLSGVWAGIDGLAGNTASGSVTNAPIADKVGCIATFVYTVTNDQGVSVSSTATMRVVSSSGDSTYNLTFTKVGSGNVTTTISGTDCSGTSCAGFDRVLAAGTSVTLTASSLSGSTFTGWSGACTGTVTTCTITMTEAKSVTATFSGATPTGTWTYSSSCPTSCGVAQSTQTQTCTGGNGTCSGSAATRTCYATAACEVPVNPHANDICSDGNTVAWHLLHQERNIGPVVSPQPQDWQKVCSDFGYGIVDKLDGVVTTYGYSASGSFTGTNAKAYAYLPIYTKTVGLKKADAPHGCMMKDGVGTCDKDNYDLYRPFDRPDDNWVDNSTVITYMDDISSSAFIAGTYSNWFAYPTGAVRKTGTVNLIRPALNVTIGSKTGSNGSLVDNGNPGEIKITGLSASYKPLACTEMLGKNDGNCSSGNINHYDTFDGTWSGDVLTISVPASLIHYAVANVPGQVFETWVKYGNGPAVKVGQYTATAGSQTALVPSNPVLTLSSLNGLTTDKFTLNWTTSTNNPTDYIMSISSNVGFNRTDLSQSTRTSFTEALSTFGLGAGTYTFTIRACNAKGCSGESNTRTYTATAPSNIPTCADPQAYYYYYNGDVAAAYADGSHDAKYHWNNYGWSEGRKSCWTIHPIAMNVTTSTLAVNSQLPQVLGDFASNVPCTNIPRNLIRGTESSFVTTLQNFLIQKGLLTEAVSGFYGDKTVEAVKDYQASKGLPTTGMLYDFTRKAIQAETCR